MGLPFGMGEDTGDPGAGCFPGAGARCCPLISCWWVRGAQGRVPASPRGRGTWPQEQQSHGATPTAIPGACQRHSPKFSTGVPRLQHHPSSPCSCIKQGCSPCPGGVPQVWLSHARQGHCPGEGTLPPAGQRCWRRPPAPMGFMATAAGASAQHREHPPPQRRQPPTGSQLQWFPTSPKHTAHFPETTNLQGGIGGGNKEGKKKRKSLQ